VPSAPVDRAIEIRRNLAAVRARIGAACAAAGRDPDAVALVAVTKFFPASDAVHLYEAGVRDFGENRDQEAAPKIAEVRDTLALARWHFVGQLQSNKVRSVVSYADRHPIGGPAQAGGGARRGPPAAPVARPSAWCR